MHLVNVACNDPGAVIGNQLILPMLQERLDDEARQAAERQAAQAELNLMQMEVLSATPSPDSMLSQQGRQILNPSAGSAGSPNCLPENTH